MKLSYFLPIFFLLVILLIIIVCIFKINENFENYVKNPMIYIINMDKDKHRLRQIVKRFQEDNLKFKRISGIDGKKLSRNEIKNNTTPLCNRFCTSSQIGCFMSHIEAWKEIANSNEIGGIVMEDDAEPVKDFYKKAKEYIKIYHKIPSLDILLFHCFGACDFNEQYDFITKIRLIFGRTNHKKISDNIFIPESPGSAGAYYISKEVANKLLKIFENKISWHVDAAVYNHPLIKGRIAMTNPPLVNINNMNSSSSSIVNEKNTFLNNIILNKKQNVSIGWFLSEPLIEIFRFKIDLKILIILIILTLIFTFYNFKYGLLLLIPTLFIILILVIIWIQIIKGK